jgi:O-antigen ligase
VTEARGLGARRWSGVRPIDLIGVALFLALAGWAQLSSTVVGGDPGPTVTLVLATGGAAFLARAVTRLHGTIVPAGAAIAIAVYTASFGTEIAAGPLSGPLGYTNAGAALYVVAVGAAGLVVVRARRWWVRLPFAALGLALAALPWFTDVIAGMGTGAVVIGAMAVLVTVPRATWGWTVPLFATAAALALVGTVVAGIVYQGDGRGDLAASTLTERRLVLWSEAIDIMVDRPLLGVGPGRFGEVSPTAREDPDAVWAHHEPLDVGAETGVPGALLLTLIVFWAFAWLHIESGCRGAALGAVLLSVAFAHACTDYVWHFAAVPIMLAAVIGTASTAGDVGRRKYWVASPVQGVVGRQ